MKRWWMLAGATLSFAVMAPVVADDPQPKLDLPQAEAPADPASDAKPETSGAPKPNEASPASVPSKESATIAELFGMQSFGKYQKNNESIRDVFGPSIQSARKATVAIVGDGELVSLGAVVDPDGLVVTKASEIDGDVVCRMADGSDYPARVIARDSGSDLAMLKIDASDLPVVDWADAVPQVGSWIVTAGLDERPLALGVVSVGPRNLAPPHAVLGVILDEDPQGVRINRVLPESGAEAAGILVNDVVQAVNGETVAKREEMIERVKGHSPGQRILLKIKRGEESLLLGAVLKDASEFDDDERRDFQNSLGGRLSDRRGGFTGVLQHDTVLQPQYCGGPICDLDGKVVGINICRAGRVESFALTSTAIQTLLADLKAGKSSDVAAAATRKTEVDRLLVLVEEHASALAAKKTDREAVLAAAEQELADAEGDLKEAESAASPVVADVDAAKKRVESSRSRVEASKKTLGSVVKSLESAEKEESVLREELAEIESASTPSS